MLCYTAPFYTLDITILHYCMIVLRYSEQFYTLHSVILHHSIYCTCLNCTITYSSLFYILPTFSLLDVNAPEHVCTMYNSE